MTQVIELARLRSTARAIDLDPFQCAFLLHRFVDAGSVVQRLIAGPIRRWHPGAIEAQLCNISTVLRQDSRLMVGSMLDHAIAVEGIEGNTYFMMPSRYNANHYRLANELRLKLQAALRCAIRPVPLIDSTPPEAA